jgi:hypothetical protein
MCLFFDVRAVEKFIANSNKTWRECDFSWLNQCEDFNFAWQFLCEITLGKTIAAAKSFYFIHRDFRFSCPV